MFLEIGIIVAAVPVGLALKKNEKVKSYVSKGLNLIVYVLLFFFGLKVGANENIMQNLDLLGFRALILSIAVIAGSIIAGIIIKKYLKGLQ